MAKTTAIRKGLWKPRVDVGIRRNNVAVNLNDNLDNVESMGLDSGDTGGDNGGDNAGDKGGDNAGDNGDDNGDDNRDDTSVESESESDYEVNTEEAELMSDDDELQNEDDEGQNEDDEGQNENEFGTSLPPYVYDDYDPYDGVVWDDDCEDMDNYLQRLYRNANNKKYTVRCNDERCYWRLHAAVLPDNITWAIKSIQGSEHTCMGLQTKNPMVTAQWACKALIEDIRAHVNIPGKAAVDGFLAGCRGVVGVDGTFLKGNYGGVLLSAVALDGNNEMFPIAWGIVSGEDEDN
ncbi:Sodium/potassium/calcium exchanger 1 [Bienertia sinuspersici]